MQDKNLKCVKKRGYTLIELVVSVGVFSIVMLLASGAYLIMISANQHAQAITTGIDSLSFALETMTRDIRTGTNYDCAGLGDCMGGLHDFSVQTNATTTVSYSLAGSALQKTVTVSGVPTTFTLTDPAVVTVDALTFYASGTKSYSASGALKDVLQPHVLIVITGTVSAGPRNPPQSFTIQTGATMRGSDL